MPNGHGIAEVLAVGTRFLVETSDYRLDRHGHIEGSARVSRIAVDRDGEPLGDEAVTRRLDGDQLPDYCQLISNRGLSVVKRGWIFYG